MPYLMGGFPDLETCIVIGAACADNGADLVELGVPFSGPAGRRPGDPRGRHEASPRRDPARRPRPPQIAEPCRWSHVLREPRLARGGALRRSARVSPPRDGLIVPDLPLGEDGAVRDAATPPGGAGAADRAHHAGRPMAEIARRARGFLYTVSVTGTTGERASVDRSLASVIDAPSSTVPSRSRSGSASPAPSRPSRRSTRGRGSDRRVVAGARRRRGRRPRRPRGGGRRVAALANALRR